MIKEAIIKLSKKEDLTEKEAYDCIDEIMSGQASDVQMASYLTALSIKGETIDEITGSAAAMRAHCLKFLNEEDVLEIVGTGGDGSNSFNISTTSSIVIASAGVKVAKHGNRAASSKSGAADCLEALGVNILVDPKVSKKILNEEDICFLFAQNYHIAMKYVAPIRRALGIRTIFNILGPLTNPAGAKMQVMGVYDESLVEPLARVLNNLGVKSAVVVYGQDGLDEISCSAPTTVCEVKNGKYDKYVIKPEDFGIKRCKKEDLVGGTPQQNAHITTEILKGKKGPQRDAVLMNAGAGLYVAGKVDTIKEGIDLAAKLIDEGKAYQKLQAFIKASNAE
ncbi:MAG: anthranilate phosphoribosyltransferase [Thomasclavelia sp.]|jgi:anthranilate phosphoribosyltransferase|nr:anthranilate phosphoribosyltransferase [Thomasclavelia sp.]